MGEHTKKDLWRYADLQRLGYGCRATIWKMVKEEKFPTPIDDGNGRPAWLPEDVKQFLASRPRYVMSQPEQLKEYQEQHCAVT